MTLSTPRPAARRTPFWTRHLRREIQYVLDLAFLASSFGLAYMLRFDFQLPPERWSDALFQLPVVILIQFTVVLLTGGYRFVWRYVGLPELQTFVRAALYSAVPLLFMRFALPDALSVWRIPIGVILMDTAFSFGGLLGLRILRRVLYEKYERQRRRTAAGATRPKRVLLAGAGRAGVLAVREIQGRGDLDLLPLGFVDDDPRKTGSVIQGLEVLGTLSEIPRLASELEIDRVVITIAEASADAVRRIFSLCDRVGLRVQIIPGLYEILEGRVSISRFRDVQIEDLLGREPVRLDEDEVRRFLSGRCAMITGAGGSIGSELARQLARFNPRRLLLVERAEGALFPVERELRELWPQLEVHALIADVGDPHRMRAILERHAPHVAFHAAAHKHVTMMEGNPTEAVRNNVLATESLGTLAGEHRLEAFVLISTDKAVEPTSIMGASKRAAELVIQDLDARYERTRFVAVRFGNVLGSTGSVVPIFRQQIQRGGPVTVTHPEARRYFMTIPEAAQLVLEAGAIGRGGDIMILDMGEPIRILDLAKDMITLSGYKPYEEIPIEFTGLRPGEKLFEQLELSGEGVDRTLHPKIFVGRLAAYPRERIARALAEFAVAVREGRGKPVRTLLQELIPEARLTVEAPAGTSPGSRDSGSRDVVH